MADDVPKALLTRRHQMYPRLDEAELFRVHRFGANRQYEQGEFLTRIGEAEPGMFIVLSGSVNVFQPVVD